MFSFTPRLANPFDLPEYVSEALSLFVESQELGKWSSDKSNLVSVSSDHEDANVVALGISRKHKEADSLRIISLWSPHNLFPIREGHFDGSCPFGKGA